jgi:hypothetical protein
MQPPTGHPVWFQVARLSVASGLLIDPNGHVLKFVQDLFGDRSL